MSDADQNARDQARATAREIVQQLEAEPAFREQVKEKPVDALTAAGLPEKWVADFLRENEDTVEPEVSGYMIAACDNSCYDVTCLCTCPATTEWP